MQAVAVNLALDPDEPDGGRARWSVGAIEMTLLDGRPIRGEERQ